MSCHRKNTRYYISSLMTYCRHCTLNMSKILNIDIIVPWSSLEIQGFKEAAALESISAWILVISLLSNITFPRSNFLWAIDFEVSSILQYIFNGIGLNPDLRNPNVDLAWHKQAEGISIVSIVTLPYSSTTKSFWVLNICLQRVFPKSKITKLKDTIFNCEQF